MLALRACIVCLLEWIAESVMESDFTLDLADEAATIEFGAAIAKVIVPELTIYLHGDLGAGKTTLVRGLLRGLGYVGRVKSPTYTLVEPYEMLDSHSAPLNLYHFDLYRFNDEEEWEAAGFRDHFNSNSVCLIEWPEKAAQVLPEPDIEINFDIRADSRSVHVSAHTVRGQQCLQHIKLK
jgi:tRNA threonylcarbamoyladenosine biosynthesis protein TsaE